MSNILKSLFTNKTIALVGPAKYMQGLPMGKEIDSHDTVVRINRSCESIESYSKNIGSKTDVLYSCLIEKPSNAGIVDVKKYLEYGIKLICVPPASDMKGIANKTRLHDLINTELVMKLSQQIPVRIVDHEFHNELSRNIDCRPNTGYMAIYDILRMNPKKLTICGFSFYLDGFIKGMKSGIPTSEEDFIQKCFTSKRHVQENMWAYAKKTILINQKVSFDNNLKNILNLENFSKDDYNKLIILKQQGGKC